MIEKYKLVNVNGEERLILFLNLNYEFGGKKNKKENFKQLIKQYIKKNKINFHGGIITFVVGGVMIGNVLFNNNGFSDYKPIYNVNYVNDEIVLKFDNSSKSINNENVLLVEEERNVVEVDEKLSNPNTKQVNTTVVDVSNDINNISIVNEKENALVEEKIEDTNIYINLQMSDGKIVKIELEEYVIGVVGAEMPALFNAEALKAQAIIARTYALKISAKGNTLHTNESNQSYKTNDELKNIWGSNYDTYYNKIKKAVNETEGMVLTYNGNYIEAVYHSTSNGVTESSVNVWGNYYPYLVSVDSKYDSSNVSFIKKIEISYQQISSKLGFNVDKDTIIESTGKTSGNRVENVKICDHVYKGIDFRNILGLRSADFDIEYTDNGIVFTTRGYGHGVGLSQYGANGMAKNGYSYEAILKHYYPGVNLKKN